MLVMENSGWDFMRAVKLGSLLRFLHTPVVVTEAFETVKYLNRTDLRYLK